MSDFNIVVAHFGHHNRVVMTDTLYQYDYGQQLKIEGITALPQTFQAHFSNVQRGGVSITVTGINGMVDVPNSLLMTGKRIYCWIYVTETGSGETVYQILMPVQSRPMPEYYDVEDVGVFDSVVDQVAEYAATATTGATSATASATAAAGSEAAAAASASAAADSAENAAASEDNAEASASAAQASDASAANAATTATAKAAEAAQSATSAGSAADRAEAAQDAAETAQEAAETAATSATTDAATASTKATAAAASATTASTKATDATNAATTATAQAVAAEAAKTTAVEAKTAAQSAQSAAETAATTATAKATEAAASATAAAQAAASINTPDSALSNTSTNAVQNKVVTAEFTDVKSAISDVTVVQNLFDAHSIVGGGYFSSSGDISANANSYYSMQYIPVTAGTEYKFTAGATASPFNIATYNASKEFVSRLQPTGTSITPASGIAYVRFSIYNQPFPTGFKFAKASDFAHITADHLLLDGQKIYNAPFQSVITQSVIADAITKDVLTYGGNYYPGSGGDKTELSTQYWYETVAQNNFDVWCETGVTYPDIMVAVYNNGTANHKNFVARYRKNSSSDTLPTESNKLSITTGQLLAISVYNDATFSFASDGMETGEKIFDTGILLNQQQINQTQDRISVMVGTGNYVIKFGDYNIKFSHITSTSSRANLWNFNGITKGSATVVGSATDIIGVLREDGEADFMGGVHGDETNVDFYILADGTPITGDVVCDRIDILMYSHLTRVSTGDNVIDRVAHITITSGVIETEVTFKSLVDNFAAYRVFAGGMWAWYEADKVYATSNIGEIAGSGSSGVDVQRSHDLYTATIITNDYMAVCENIIGRDVEGSYGNAFYYGNEANPRMKMYLGALENIVLNTGDYVKGKARYTLM